MVLLAGAPKMRSRWPRGRPSRHYARVEVESHPFRAGLIAQTRRKVTNNRDDGASAQQAMDEVNALVLRQGPWTTDRFKYVGVIINILGSAEEAAPEPIVRRITKGELPVVVDAYVEDLRRYRLDLPGLVVEYKRLMLRGLVAGLRAKGQDASFAEEALEAL